MDEIVSLIVFLSDKAHLRLKLSALQFSQVLASPDDHRRVPASAGASKALEKFEPIHLRHNKIEDHGGRLFPGRCLERAETIWSANGPIAQLAQHFVGKFERRFVIINDEDGTRTARKDAAAPERF